MSALRALCCLAALLLQAVTGMAWAANGQWLNSAKFAAGLQNQEAPANLGWQAVPLPDDWRTRGVPRPGVGRYQLQFDLPQGAGEGVWGLWSAQLPLHHRIHVNGQLVSDTLAMAEGLQPRTGPGRARLTGPPRH